MIIPMHAVTIGQVVSKAVFLAVPAFVGYWLGSGRPSTGWPGWTMYWMIGACIGSWLAVFV